jgi:O-antigen/teichoic acid export membrane protein
MNMNPQPAAGSVPSRYGPTRLFRDAGSLAFTSVGIGVFGAGFWALAAKLYPPEQIGVMTAIVAVINSVGIVVGAAAGDAYTALLPAVGSARIPVYRRGRRIHGVLAFVGGAGGAIAVTSLLPQVRASIGVGILVAVGIVVWSTFVLQNSTLVALGHTRWYPAANIAASLGRLVILPILAATINWHSVELAFVVAAAIGVASLWRPIERIITSGEGLAEISSISKAQALRELDKLAAQTFAMAALTMGVTVSSPFVVTIFAGPKPGALFALCFTVAQLIDVVVSTMCISLVVHAANQPEHGGRMARALLIRTLGLAILAALLVTLTVPAVLPHLNPQYGEMGSVGVIAMLGLATVIRVFSIVWSELQRSRRRMRAPLLVNLLAAVALFTLIPALAPTYGALGGAIAVVALRVVQSCGAVMFVLVGKASDA